LMSVCII